MRLKQRIGDFRVRELLIEDYLQEKGEYRVYRVTKRKITTPEALDVLAAEAGVEVSSIGLAGWKDRQGITVQYMSIPRGRVVRLQSQELLIETEGFAREPYSSEFSRGNAFEINVRNLVSGDLNRMRANLPLLRQFGYVDYFDDQRFGNLIHGQGWIAKDLMLGDHERALKAMIAAPSPRDNDYFTKFKGALERCWGDWKACRDVAGRYGAHHSVFEALGRDSDDFAGAFMHISSRFRLIHLYAWQSHLWNRAVTRFMRDSMAPEERLLIDCVEGVLVMPAGEPSPEIQGRTSFRLPGELLADVVDPAERAAYEDILADEGMIADQLHIDGVSGFFMKGEPRSLMVKPSHLRVRPALDDPLNPGARMVRIRFELPRGSYASLLIKRLFSYGPRSDEDREREAHGSQRHAPSYRGHADSRGEGYRGRPGFRDDRYADARPGYTGEREGTYRGGQGGGHRGGQGGGYRRGAREGQGGGYRGGQREGQGRGHRGESQDGFRGERSTGREERPQGDQRGQGNRGGYRSDQGDGNRGAQGGGYRAGQGGHGGGYRGGQGGGLGGGYRDGQGGQGGGSRGGQGGGSRGGQGGGYRRGQGGGQAAGYRGGHGGGYRDGQGGGDRGGPRGNQGASSRDHEQRPDARGRFDGARERDSSDQRFEPRPKRSLEPGSGGDQRQAGESRSSKQPRSRPASQDKQSGGYRKPGKGERRPAPERDQDGWS